MAPHVNVWIVARGINIGLNTRIYFADEAEANAEDPVLRLIEPAERRADADRARASSAAARPSTASTSACRASSETVFFDV